MYQLEVKYQLVRQRFSPRDGWKVFVDIDAMERAKGGTHPAGKKIRVAEAENSLVALGAGIGVHPFYGRVDVAAEHPDGTTVLVEVEGTSSRQKEQAVYSALGQLILQMDTSGPLHYMLAVPDGEPWQRQLRKVPNRIRQILNLSTVVVSQTSVQEISSGA